MIRLVVVALNGFLLSQVKWDKKITAPMIYKETMTSDFFTRWYEDQLLPDLNEPHVIVMDNSTFDFKVKMDELLIAQGHYFLALSPYSPELNPIERYWATLKQAVTELLRRFLSVEECLEYYLKTHFQKGSL